MRLITGSLYGARSPVHTLSAMFYADITLVEGAHLAIPTEHEERAAFIVEGVVQHIWWNFVSSSKERIECAIRNLTQQ